MTDRELLGLAAKAAGIKLYVWGSKGKENFADVSDAENHKLWNPLTDDGDALRLAVKLGATVYTSIVACHIWATDDKEVSATAEPTGYRYAATRRAIVRAAAEIGRAM